MVCFLSYLAKLAACFDALLSLLISLLAAFFGMSPFCAALETWLCTVLSSERSVFDESSDLNFLISLRSADFWLLF